MKKVTSIAATTPPPLTLKLEIDPPDFQSLLSNPAIDLPLPPDFDVNTEVEHLNHLWKTIPRLQNYVFELFVHAGGSGMVFKVVERRTSNPRAIKIARSKLYHLIDESGELATSLSPVSEHELRALERISHPNVVRLFDVIEEKRGVVGICTTYIEHPQNLDLYLKQTLQRVPQRATNKAAYALSPKRLDDACTFLLSRVSDLASALHHMHSQGMFHFDIKPANILLSPSDRRAMLTDMGSCIHADSLVTTETRVHFTWTYAHPDLTTIVSDPREISGGGLKSSAKISVKQALEKFDLFAFGKTIQEILAILVDEFGERCHASYAFRYLHLIACLLLDGRNSPVKVDVGSTRLVEKDGRRFVSDVALDYPTDLFEAHKITSAEELMNRLSRFGKQFSWGDSAPELDVWQPELINAATHQTAPFTKRVSQVFNHPTVRRLKAEHQLGWIREVYPGATHDRWSHSLGVFGMMVRFYNSLLSDPEVPTFRILVDADDIVHALVAAIVHDLGQTEFGHDFEEACPGIFTHEALVEWLLKEKQWGEPALEDVLKRAWPRIDLDRVLAIVGDSRAEHPRPLTQAVDGVARDALRGPIDTDKMDYLLRDSIACGVPYGLGVDTERFLKALTVSAKQDSTGVRLALAYKAKGRAAVASLLLARYQMFGAVYWHHTFRCIQAMFVHAVASTFSGIEKRGKRIRGQHFSRDIIQNLLYQRVICGKSWEGSLRELRRNIPIQYFANAPSLVAGERALEFVWQFADDDVRPLIEQLASRQLFKRVFEMRLGELGGRADYSALKAELKPELRPALARTLQKRLLDTVLNAMRERGPIVSIAESAAKERHSELNKRVDPLIVIDFPSRGIPDELNTPKEIGDAVRKYFVLPSRTRIPEDDIFEIVRGLQQKMATLRIFAAPELHELVIRYLTPAAIEQCVESVLRSIRRTE